jgi:hypothetical protein
MDFGHPDPSLNPDTLMLKFPFLQDALPDVLGASVEEFNFKSVISEPHKKPESHDARIPSMQTRSHDPSLPDPIPSTPNPRPSTPDLES